MMGPERIEAIIKYVYLDKTSLNKADADTRTRIEDAVRPVLPGLGDVECKVEALQYSGLGSWWYIDGKKGSKK